MIDDLDRQIIELLMTDARQSSNVLAKKLHVDAYIVRRRVHQLIQDKVICITALPALQKAGFPVQAIIGLDIDNRELNDNLQIICEIPQCQFVWVTSGKFNVMIIVWCHSLAEVYNVVRKMLFQLKGVKSSETFTCMNMAKSVNPIESQNFMNQPGISPGKLPTN